MKKVYLVVRINYFGFYSEHVPYKVFTNRNKAEDCVKEIVYGYVKELDFYD